MGLVKREQIAGMNIHYMRYSLEYFLDAQVRAGIKTIEFWTGVPHYYLDPMVYGDCKELKKKINDRGLEVKVFTPENCMYQFQFAANKPLIFEKSFQYFSNGIKAAAELGCKIMQCNSGWGYLDETREEAWKRSVEMLSRLAEVAKKEGITLALESLRPEESNLVIRLEDVKRMIREVNHPNMKVLIDTTAMAVAGETLQQWFEVFGKDIIHMHFVDGNPYGHLIWGDGYHNLKEFLTVLKDNHYEGYLGQEITDSKYFKDPMSHDIRNMEQFSRYI
ncbi:sugar phosphate isomerase/epimerase family protein [Clostridium magnum]|uniref:Endonuclease 4 n=1 Tax=Clostridium magnum DSM 2767 TaxID=1121326 RepID=A0A161YKD9_9CLOT|nr:sugar phosphate isomerase/epimerase family protein [Clostridium magnum]KZL90982.1 endonuclease 4 [Clostridium magnum DSM 2767]SHI99153.1 protein FrlC [Clostridium magnum DSM 2767]